MKKLVLTAATVLFISGLSMAVQVVVPSSGDTDTKEASHNVGITIPTVAIVDIEEEGGSEAGTITLKPDVSSLEAGSAVDFSTATDNSLWLNYTSIVTGNSNSSSREITVELDNENNLPAGVSIKLQAGNAASTGKGTKGTPVSGGVTLSEDAQNLITGIGSCYTGSGFENGHQLTYTLNMDNDEYADLMAKSYEVQVTYTITGN